MLRRLLFWLPYVYFHQLLCIPFGDKRYKTIIIYNAFKTYLMLTPFFVSLWIWLRSKASCDYQERFLLQYHMSQRYNDLVISIVQYIYLGYTIHLHSCLISNLAKKSFKNGKDMPTRLKKYTKLVLVFDLPSTVWRQRLLFKSIIIYL